MGEKDRLRKLAWPMKQGSFERIEGTKAARCSDGKFGVGVQCLDDSAASLRASPARTSSMVLFSLATM